MSLRPGALRSRLSRTRTQKRPAEKHAPQFHQWLRGRPCAVESESCDGKIHAAHVDHAGGKGVGTKVGDRFSIPLCAHHHHVQHTLGWATFETRQNINAVSLADEYFRAWPGRIQWLRKLAEAADA